MSRFERKLAILLVIAAAGIMLLDFDARAQDASSMKERAIIAFRNADYPRALELLKEAAALDPENAEIMYYLGYVYHYLCYDSVPLSGFSLDDSDLVLEYLEKALELDPEIGDARYFIGAEYGARARYALSTGDTAAARRELLDGARKGGYPPWMIEYGRNVLRSCDPDAILITGGDAGTNPVFYLQLVDGFRTDVTAMASPLLGRPWYIRLVKEGVPGLMPPAPLSWSDYQVMNVHPYKWKRNAIEVNVEPEVAAYYGLAEQSFRWQLEPDLNDGSLSPAGAVTADIVKTNGFRRPIHFSVDVAQGMLYGLKDSMQLCGMTYRLLPLKVGNDHPAIDIENTTRVLMEGNMLRSVSTYAAYEMPRPSSLLQNYRIVLLRMVHHYYGSNEKERAREVFDFMEKSIPESVFPSGNLGDHIGSLRKLLE